MSKTTALVGFLLSFLAGLGLMRAIALTGGASEPTRIPISAEVARPLGASGRSQR
jgi:hypothetical protein